MPSSSASTTSAPRASGPSSVLQVKLLRRSRDLVPIVFAAALMVVSGLDHLHLWDIAYRHVATLGPLFLVQTIAAFVGAVVLVISRQVVVVIGSALLMVGTIVGFILAATVGLFGFTLPEVTGWAYLALVTEAISALVLAVVALRSWRQSAGS